MTVTFITTALALAGRGLGAEPTNKLLHGLLTMHCLPRPFSRAGQRSIIDGSQICDLCDRGIILLLLIHLNQGQGFPYATFLPVPASYIHRRCKAN